MAGNGTEDRTQTSGDLKNPEYLMLQFCLKTSTVVNGNQGWEDFR